MDMSERDHINHTCGYVWSSISPELNALNSMNGRMFSGINHET